MARGRRPWEVNSREFTSLFFESGVIGDTRGLAESGRSARGSGLILSADDVIRYVGTRRGGSGCGFRSGLTSLRGLRAVSFFVGFFFIVLVPPGCA